ncbi:MAG: molybdopterin molybdotransferase MoeA [Euryarchaeota archaeon]|nr:molybdopterin molybdotransferase MoeA [Euryarchaeota archaeon]
MVEHTSVDGDAVTVQRGVRARENVSPRGGDLRSSDIAVARGSVIQAPRTAVLAALGLTTANVHDRPRVLLLSTGTELRTPGETLEPGLIYDSNSPALTALLTAHGARVERAGIIPDDERLMRDALRRGAGYDLVLVTGSSSAGERDYLVDAVHELGTVRFHGVNVKPGKPLLLAEVQSVPILGLAGNPASCLLMAHVLVAPALRRFQHLRPMAAAPVTAKLGHDLPSPKGKRHFAPVRVTGGEAQSVYKESDATTSLSNADGYIEVAEDVEMVPRGTLVEIQPF